MEETVRLTGEECLAVRSLWSEIFFEDSDRFTEYYFKEKMTANKGYGVRADGELVSMMFLTPYRIWIKMGDAGVCAEEYRQLTLYYIVGVGTKKEYRHRGYMDRMLKEALGDISDEGHPFTFLMPADPAIYMPYQFRYIYDRPTYAVRQSEAVSLEPSEIPELAGFANMILRSRFQIFTHRDAAYYERQRRESAAQNGDVYLWKQKGEIKGYYLYAKEDDHEEIQEAMLSQDFYDQSVLTVSQERKPIIMARITDVKAMLSLIRMKGNEEKKLILQVHDPLIKKNSGTFLWTLNGKSSEAVDITKGKGKELTGMQGEMQRIEVDITSLCDFLFGRLELPESFRGMKPFTDICINEIV